MVIPSSPDISQFNLHALYDLSGPTPYVKITNQSVGANLNLCKVFFVLLTSTGIKYHEGTASLHDALGNFTEWNSPEIMQMQGHIEFGALPFRIYAYVQDSAATTFGPLEIKTVIKCPPGNTGRGNFAKATLREKVLCAAGRLRFEDITNYGYMGLAGVLLDKTVKLIYPADSTGSVPAPWENTNVNGGQIPIWYSHDNYQLLMDAFMLYHSADGLSTVKLKYKYNECIPVRCNIDLCKVSCEVQRYAAQLGEGCTSAQVAKLALINAKLNAAIVGHLQPTCGIDIAGLVKEIEELIGVDCGCSSTSYSGILQQTMEQQTGTQPNGSCATPTNLNGTIS